MMFSKYPRQCTSLEVFNEATINRHKILKQLLRYFDVNLELSEWFVRRRHFCGEFFFDLDRHAVMFHVPPFTGIVNLLSDIVFSEFWKSSATIMD